MFGELMGPPCGFCGLPRSAHDETTLHVFNAVGGGDGPPPQPYPIPAPRPRTGKYIFLAAIVVCAVFWWWATGG